MKKSLRIAELEIALHTARNDLVRAGAETQTLHHEIYLLRREIATAPAPPEHVFIQTTNSRGERYECYEGTTVESFALWAAEILWPVVIKDLRELGYASNVRLQGRIW